MAFEFKLPDLGEGVHEGEIVRWLVKVGDTVRADQPVVEVMTDKVTAELPIPVGGVVSRLAGDVGDVIRVGEVLIEVQTEGEATAAAPEPALLATEDGLGAPEAPVETPGPRGAQAQIPPGRPIAMPAVRRLARELGVDLHGVTGSGPGGRIVESDVRGAAGQPSTEAVPPMVSPVLPPAEAPAGREPRRIPLRGVRRAIAEHLLEAHRNTAPYTFVEEADFTELVSLRTRVQPLADKAGVRITFLPFIVAAVSMALREHPELNATVDPENGDLLLHEEHHLALAVHTDEGLVVPVLRNVERRNLLDIAREIERLSQGARSGRLTRDEVTGGTFSITSLGLRGGLLGTPMLNTPQVAVLGVHRISPRAVVRDGNVVARQTANLSLTLDHRYIDGYAGAGFAQTLVRYLEDPALMMFWLSEMRA